jgi:hypothetical protein
MKLFLALSLLSTSAFALMPMPGAAELKIKSAKVLAACRDDKSKVKGCESYTEVAPLKECLMKNKEMLSEKCKTELATVK